MFNFSLLADIPQWLANTMVISRYVIVGVIALCAVAIIFLVLFQKSNSDGGLNAISGVQETYFSQNKGQTRDGLLKKLTVILAIIIAVLAIVYWITLKVYNPTV